MLKIESPVANDLSDVGADFIQIRIRVDDSLLELARTLKLVVRDASAKGKGNS
jgi:hypothetical protein